MHINQIELLGAILKELERQHKGLSAKPRYMNACIAAADGIVAELGRDDVVAGEGEGLNAWMASDDTGLSSLFMAHVMAYGPPARHAYPLDPSDFGRCYRFLRAVTGTRERLHMMREHGPVWSAFVDQWGDMESLWEEEAPTNNCPKLYDLMQRIRKEAGE